MSRWCYRTEVWHIVLYNYSVAGTLAGILSVWPVDGRWTKGKTGLSIES